MSRKITAGTVKKLVTSLTNKNNYVIHHRNLQQCLELGMKLKKIHRILKFRQSDWTRPYIDFNTKKRIISNNEADNNFFKLMNNSVYCKTTRYKGWPDENDKTRNFQIKISGISRFVVFSWPPHLTILLLS